MKYKGLCIGAPIGLAIGVAFASLLDLGSPVVSASLVDVRAALILGLMAGAMIGSNYGGVVALVMCIVLDKDGRNTVVGTMLGAVAGGVAGALLGAMIWCWPIPEWVRASLVGSLVGGALGMSIGETRDQGYI
jgi:hypothetical protein